VNATSVNVFKGRLERRRRSSPDGLLQTRIAYTSPINWTTTDPRLSTIDDDLRTAEVGAAAPVELPYLAS